MYKFREEFEMKQRMQGMVMGILATILLLGTVTAFSADTRTIEATFGNFRTYLFDQEFTVRNTQGEVLQPFMYNGSLYLPAEAILHAMGENASWDATTGVFRFGSVDAPPTRERVQLQTAAPFFDTGWSGTGNMGRASVSEVAAVEMGGVTYHNVLRFRTNNVSHGIWTTAHNSRAFSLHNLNGQYRLLSGYVGRIDGSVMTNARVDFIGDGELLQSHDLDATAMPIPVNVLVEGVRQLRVEIYFIQHGVRNSYTEYAFVGYLQ